MTPLIRVCRSATLTPAAYQLYCAILRTFPARGSAPNPTQMRHLADRFTVPIAETLADMVAQDLIQLDATAGAIRTAYPFSSGPTQHRVMLAPDAGGSLRERKTQQVFAMCALDALGIPLMLRRAATIVSEDALTHAPVQVTIELGNNDLLSTLDGWAGHWDPPHAVVYARPTEYDQEQPTGCMAGGCCCPTTNFFTEAAHARQWAELHLVSDGVVLTPDEALHHALALFGGVLHRAMEKD